MKLSITPGIRLFNETQLEQILQKALTVLRKVPFRIQGTDELFDYLTAYGCRVDGENVYFPSAVIDKVMVRCETEKRKALAAHEKNRVSPNNQEVTTFTHGQSLQICDMETNTLRMATEQDLAQWCHAVDELGIPDRHHPTFIPGDVPIETADFHAFATIMLNSSKPHRVSVYSAQMVPFYVEACKIAKGSLDAVKADPVFASFAWVTSPFMLDRENVEIAMTARRLIGTPVSFGHMPVAGASTPVGVAGALVQNTAESLALSAIRLAVDDLPQKISGTSAVMDMRYGFPRQMGPDISLHHLAGMEMDDYLYRGYAATSGFSSFTGTGAATVSIQSVCDKTCGMMLGAMSGIRQFGVGSLAFGDVGSPVQLIIDMDLIGFIQHMLRDVSMDDEHIDMESIFSTIPFGGRYMESDNTFEFFREETWMPSLMHYRSYKSWADNPPDMIAEAREKAKDLYAQAENRCSLSDDQQKSIRKLMCEADETVKRNKSANIAP